MALSSAFQERLELMERTRIQRLSLLQLSWQQEERELQLSKCRTLESKRSSIKSSEQKCFCLELKIAAQNFRISLLKSQIEDLESEHSDKSNKLKELKCEIEELEKLDKEKQRFYEFKELEMKEFDGTAERFIKEYGTHVERLRKRLNELKFTLEDLQGNYGTSSYSDEITSAETKKAELLVEKEQLAKSLAESYQLKSCLQKQVQNLRSIRTREGRQ